MRLIQTQDVDFASQVVILRQHRRRWRDDCWQARPGAGVRNGGAVGVCGSDREQLRAQLTSRRRSPRVVELRRERRAGAFDGEFDREKARRSNDEDDGIGTKE